MTNFLPRIREDLLITAEPNNPEFIIISDPLKLNNEDIAIPLGFLPLIQLLDGHSTMDDIEIFLSDNNLNTQEVLPLFRKVVNILEEYAFLETERYFLLLDELDNYIAAPIRPSVLAGSAYSSDKNELKIEINNILNHYPDTPNINNANAIIVPHIDFHTGEAARNAYSAAYKSIEETIADTYIIFGTSHYYNNSGFMLCSKNYSTPLGIIQTDNELMDEISKHIDIANYTDDQAHRLEHSIEFQAVLLQNKFPDKQIKILPILCGASLIDNHNDEINNKFINALNTALGTLNKKPVFIVSADFAHIGIKHNSNINAADNRTILETADRELINTIKTLKPELFAQKIINEYAKWQICGAAPIIALLKTTNYTDTSLEYYGQWYEHYYDSLVSFAAISFK